jgi:hypothetical protein
MEKISMTQFHKTVATAADQMIDALEKQNKKSEAGNGVYTLGQLRPRFVAYFRRLLSAEYEIRPEKKEEEQVASAPSRYR